MQFGQVARQVGRVGRDDDEAEDPPNDRHQTRGECERQKFPALVKERLETKPKGLFPSGEAILADGAFQLPLQPHQGVERAAGEENGENDGYVEIRVERAEKLAEGEHGFAANYRREGGIGERQCEEND